MGEKVLPSSVCQCDERMDMGILGAAIKNGGDALSVTLPFLTQMVWIGKSLAWIESSSASEWSICSQSMKNKTDSSQPYSTLCTDIFRTIPMRHCHDLPLAEFIILMALKCRDPVYFSADTLLVKSSKFLQRATNSSNILFKSDHACCNC